MIIRFSDWKVIPLENLIAKTRKKTKLLAEVSSAKEAKLALETLEIGADGVVLNTKNLEELVKTVEYIKKMPLKVDLVRAEIKKIEEIGVGARVCVDTCELMKSGEGFLVGCQSSGLFLIQAEVYESPYVESRPFRVNAGPVALYTFSLKNRTKYLSELKAGDEVLIVDRKGWIRTTNVARIKIEWRPLILVEAEYSGKKLRTIVQNAETIRFVTEENSRSICELKPGDTVLVYVVKGGRHFGILVSEETVMEK